ncbi:NB-ARC [Dillenia turbinata]|uniref:NB-ARC n=1 Tax=Dillenia turbinata TaxID=194707 RepID=A0AAN8UW03_9MAGN
MFGLDEDGICTMCNLVELFSQNLIVIKRKDADKVDGYYNEHFVLQHDILRELAIYQSVQELIEHRKRLIAEVSGDKFPKWSDQEQLCVTARLLWIFSSNWPRVELPEVEVLVLNFQTLKYIFLSSFENMPKLKAFKSITLKMSSLFPNLIDIELDYCKDLVKFPQSLGDLVSLKNLCISNCPELGALPAEIEKLKSLEVLRLHACLGLSKLPDSACSLHKFYFIDLRDCEGMKKLPEKINNLTKLRYLDMGGCLNLLDLPESVMELTRLEVVTCTEEVKELWESHKLHLRMLHIKNLRYPWHDEDEIAHYPERTRNYYLDLYQKTKKSVFSGEYIGMEPEIGAFVGELAGELLGTLSDIKNKVTGFKSEFKRLESTLRLMIPKLNETKELNRELGCQGSGIEKLDESLKEGKELVKRCSEVYWWDVWSKFRCSKMILKLDESLSSFCHRDLLLENSIDNKKILVEMKRSFKRRDSSHSALSCTVPELPALVVELDEPLVEPKRKLLQENQVKEKYGESIIFVTASNYPNVKVIAQRVFEQMDEQLAQFQNDEDAINQLKCLLNQNDQRCRLLVLDDVWPGSEHLLNHLLSPVPGCQVLVTSRYKFPTFGSTYKWKFLNDREAMKLFCHLAFPQDCSYTRPDEELLNKIVRRCKGLPLAIAVMANSLCRQPEVMWQHLEKKCSEGQSILEYDYEGYLLDCLASSIEFLDDIVKDCFLDLGSFPEDQKISASTLLDIWVEVYGLDEDDVYVNLLELSARNLLNVIMHTRKNITEVDCCYNELFVVQHDLLRELAIHYGNRHNFNQRDRIFMNEKENYFAKRFTEQNLGPLRARLLSITTDDAFSSSWFNVLVPELEVLILNLSATTYTLPKFMNETNNLKLFGIFPNLVEIEFDYCYDLIELPAGLCGIISLQKLWITNCHRLSTPPREIGELENLVQLRLHACTKLVGLPNTIGHLRKLIFIDISNCSSMKKLPEPVGQLHSLTKLDMRRCSQIFDVPTTVEHLVNLEEVICDEVASVWEDFRDCLLRVGNHKA